MRGFEALEMWLQEAGKGSERPKGDAWARFACGLAAGTLAKLVTNPLDVAKKRYQVAGLQRSTMSVPPPSRAHHLMCCLITGD